MHRLLVFAATGLAALVLSGSAMAWSWPADGDVLRPFALGGDAYAAGQHRGVDVAGAEGSAVRAPASGTADSIRVPSARTRTFPPSLEPISTSLIF